MPTDMYTPGTRDKKQEKKLHERSIRIVYDEKFLLLVRTPNFPKNKHFLHLDSHGIHVPIWQRITLFQCIIKTFSSAQLKNVNQN